MSKYIQQLLRPPSEDKAPHGDEVPSKGNAKHEEVGSLRLLPRALREPTLGARSVPLAAARSQRRAPALDGSLAYEGLDKLLDSLLAVEGGRDTRRVVFAATTPGETVRTLVEGLAARAGSRGVKALALTLEQSGGRTVLHAPGASEPLALDPGAEATSNLDAWLESIAAGASLALIEAPALGTLGDAGLLSRVGEGLVIVVQAGRTNRTALRAAAELARATECRTLGIVVNGSPNRLPAWLGRVFSS